MLSPGFPAVCLPVALTRVAFAPESLDARVWCEVLPLGEGERQALAARLSRLLEDESEGDAKGGQTSAEELAREVVLPRIVGWNLRGSDRQPLPRTAAGLAQLSRDWLGWLFALVTGTDDLVATRQREQARDQSLIDGIHLVRTAPQVAWRDCDDCQRHIYDDLTGQRALFQGRPIPRPAGTQSPCRVSHLGCPKGTPESPRSLTPELWELWHFDRQRRASGQPAPTPEAARLSLLIQLAEQGQL
jgi:hypothetical protein